MAHDDNRTVLKALHEEVVSLKAFIQMQTYPPIGWEEEKVQEDLTDFFSLYHRSETGLQRRGMEHREVSLLEGAGNVSDRQKGTLHLPIASSVLA